MRVGPLHSGRSFISLRGLGLAPSAAAPGLSLNVVVGRGDRRALALGPSLSPLVTSRAAARTVEAVNAAATLAAASAGAASRIRSVVRDASRALEAAVPEIATTPPLAYSASPNSNRSSRTETLARTVYLTSLTGLNPAQIKTADVGSLVFLGSLTVEGDVTQAAGTAQLVVRGGTGATATAGGTYRLSGSLGEVMLELQQGESLFDIAAQINQYADSTGVAAEVVGDDLFVTSTNVGSAALVQIETVESQYSTVVDGVNSSQVGSFTVASLADGASETLTGSILSTAENASLVYHADEGAIVAGNVSFRLSGTRGSTNVTLVQGESLADAADRINQETASTGVVAAVVGNDLYLTSDTLGAAATVQIDSIVRTYDTAVSGVNAAQVAGFSIVSLDPGSSHTLTGEVTRSASQAVLTLQGSAEGTVIDTAEFELAGSLGTASISITEGESLSAVADRVNALTGSTGVVASVSNDQLVFSSSNVGSNAQVQVALTHVSHTTIVSGVDAQQFTAFQVDSFTEGASSSLSGSVTQTASVAELTFAGNNAGKVNTNATFTLTGSLGSSQFVVTKSQTLSDLADQVNAVTAVTGVTAVVEGNDIQFRSVGVGTSATVEVEVTLGTFNVTGGNGDGTANGANAVVVVNGQTITAAGTGYEFTFSDANGSYSFTAAAGFTGAFSTIDIVSQAGSFDIAGGNGDGTATGLDALAVINGNELTGTGNQFTFSQPGGEFELLVADGYTGQLDDIAVSSTAQPFDVEGGDENGIAVGTDTVATINAVEYSSADYAITVQGGYGTFELEFVPGAAGELDPITVSSVAQVLQIEGGTDGLALGRDAEALINGEQLVADRSIFQFDVDGQNVTLEFQAGFEGAFDPITATRLTRHVTETIEVWDTSPAAPLQPSEDNAPISSAPTVAEPLQLALQQLDTLVEALQPVSLATEEPQSSDERPLTKADIVSDSFTKHILLGRLASLLASAAPHAAAALFRAQHTIDLLA